MDRDAAATVADLILTSTQKGPGTVVPDPSANKTANNGPQSDPPIEGGEGRTPWSVVVAGEGFEPSTSGL